MRYIGRNFLLWQQQQYRASSPPAPSWTPADLAGLVAWFKSDTGVTLNGGNVSQWDDQSGDSRNLVQATAASQPLYVASDLNGYPSVSFDGTDDFLKTSSFTLNQPQTICILFKLSGTPPILYGNIHDGNVDNTMSLECGNTASSSWYAYAGSFLANKTINTSDWHLSILTFNGVSGEWYFDSEVVATGNGGSNNASGLTLGRIGSSAGFYSYYKTAECFVLNTTVSTDDVTEIKTYINTKYGLSFT